MPSVRPLGMSLAMLACAAGATAAEPIKLERCRLKFIEKVTLAAERAGILGYIEPGEGDPVEKSATVAGLKDEVVKATLAVAQEKAVNDIEIRYALKAREVADATYDAAVEANRMVPGTFSKVELRQKKLEAERAALQIEQATHQQKVAGLERDELAEQLKTFHITAPCDGYVSKILKRPGEAVSPQEGILEVVSNRRVKVEGYVDLQDSWRVRRGASVKVAFEIKSSGAPTRIEEFIGKVIFVDQEAQAVTQQVRVAAEVENRDDILRAGLTAAMWIEPSALPGG